MEEKYRIDGVYLVANIKTGVQIHGDMLEDPEIVLLSPVDFYESLRDLDDDEIVYTHIDGENEELFDRIQDEYEIR